MSWMFKWRNANLFDQNQNTSSLLTLSWSAKFALFTEIYNIENYYPLQKCVLCHLCWGQNAGYAVA